MRKEEALMTLLRGLVDLLGEEAARNPDFASRLQSLLSPLPKAKTRPKKPLRRKDQEQLPDIYAEWNKRGESEFRLWLRDQPIGVLRAIIRLHDLDASRRTTKWKDPEKLSAYIADHLQSRLARGSSFLRGGVVDTAIPKSGRQGQEESARDKAVGLAHAAGRQRERESFLRSPESGRAARESLGAILKCLEEEIDSINRIPNGPRIRFDTQGGAKRVQGPSRSFTIEEYQSELIGTVPHRTLLIQEFDGVYSLDGSHRAPWDRDSSRQPRLRRSVKMLFDLDAAGTGVWREKDTTTGFYSAEEISEKYLKWVLDAGHHST